MKVKEFIKNHKKAVIGGVAVVAGGVGAYIFCKHLPATEHLPIPEPLCSTGSCEDIIKIGDTIDISFGAPNFTCVQDLNGLAEALCEIPGVTMKSPMAALIEITVPVTE